MLFICQECGKREMITVAASKRQKYCRECREKIRRERMRKAGKRYKEKIKAEKLQRKAALPDAEQDAWIIEQIKVQCRGQDCEWWSEPTRDAGCCTYYYNHGVGHRVDHGDQPGDCRCFKQREGKEHEPVIERECQSNR